MSWHISETIFIGDSEMARLMRSLDWSQTPLGPVETWSQSLKTAVRIMLTSRQAMFVWWGDDLINLYNDAYRAILGGKHPKALAQPAAVVWREIWDQVGPRAETALLKNEGTYDEALLLIMERNGYPEETYYTFSYSPIANDDGNTGGIICANTDDTPRIIGERQLGLLKELAAKTADARTFDQACTLSARCLATNPYDLPFAMIYLVDPDQQSVRLAGTCGIERDHPAVPEVIAIDQGIWHFAEVVNSHEPYLISELEFADLPTGAWDRSPHQAVVVPIAPSGRTGKAGILVAGINPFRLFDENYQGFLNLVSAQIAASIANAQAYEEERKRAEALAELDRAKTTFFSNVSHEFRTPLTLMLGPLEDLLAAAIPQEQQQQLELVYRNSLRLLKLVNTLLDFSRIEAGRIQVVYELTDLSELTAELASVFRSAIEQAGLQFIVDCQSIAAPVYVDREMWEKIVLNLLSNAFKFTLSGTIAIALHQAQDQIELTVRDTGIGIPTAELPRLFERFYRVEGAQGRTQEGSGIGLSLVQELVRLHGGQVQVESREGEGTTFTITIPTGTAHLPQERIQATRTLASTALGATAYGEEALRWLPEGEAVQPERIAEAERSPSLPALSPSHPPIPIPARILLADDNSDMRSYVKRLLLSQGYEVETAADGLAALTMAQQNIPDLVLTDVMMPRLDGFGLLRELRATPDTRNIPIILLSARAGEEARVEGLEVGADDYLTKPFSARELLARVEASLKLARLRREATQREQALRLEAETAKQTVETILSSINDGFYVLDRHWRYTYVSDRYCEMAGVEREVLLGQRIWDLFADTVNTDLYRHLQQVMTVQTPVQFEYLYATWNRWYEHRVYPSADGVTVFIAEITDRKQAEAALRQSEERLRIALKSAPINTFSQDRQLRYTWIENPMFNYQAEQVLGKQDSDLVSPEAAAILTRIKQQVLETEIGRREEVKLTQAGREYYYDLTVDPLKDGNGTVVGIICAAIDISELKQIELALRESEERFRLLAERVQVIPWEADPVSGQFTYVGPQAVQILGYPLQDWYTDNFWTKHIYCPDRVWVPQFCLESAAALDNYDFEYRMLTADGRVVWLYDVVNVVRQENEPKLLRGIMIDITQRKRQEEAQQYLAEVSKGLSSSLDYQITLNQLAQQMVPHLADWCTVHVLEEDGSIQPVATAHTNPAKVKWADEIRQRYPLNPNDPQGIPQVLRTGQSEFYPDIADALLVEAARDPEHLRLLRQVGFRSAMIVPMQAHGKTLGTLTLIAAESGRCYDSIDLTLAEELARRAALAVDNARLYKKAQREQAKAEAANRIKDEFLAVLSHELRTPLNPILGWSRLLQTQKMDEAKTAQALATIERNAKLQTQLIEDLLDVSRILRGKLSLSVVPVNLVPIIESAKETVQLAAEAKGIDIRTILPVEIEAVSGDSARLQQIIWNLLSNAVKFTPSGGRVEVWLERVDKKDEGNKGNGRDGKGKGDGEEYSPLSTPASVTPPPLPPSTSSLLPPYAQITITDTGKGISPEFLPYVFDYFRQEDGKTTRRFGGLGLGLAIVRHLVELHGGMIQAHSLGEGLGATFTVRLPLIGNRELPDKNQKYRTGSLFLAPSSPLAGLQILVVDDDPDTREFVTFLLKQAGAKVIAAASADEALTVLIQSQPAVLISDIGMPNIDGYTLMRQVRALPPEQGGQIPAIALTAYASESDQKQALGAGFQQHIPKPVEPEALIQMVSSLFK